nr:MetaGeneMark_Unknown Function [uncultured bacterium]
MFGRIGGVDVRGAGIRAHSQQGEAAGCLEIGIQCELVIHLRNAVRVGACASEIDVIGAGFQAGAHNSDVSRRKCRVQDESCTGLTNSSGDGRLVSGIETERGHSPIVQLIRKEGSAGGHRVGDDELLEHRLLHEFEGGHGPHRAGT